MGTKTISIMDDAYNFLVRQKKENESFSDVIRQLASKKGDIMECAGLWQDLSDKQIEAMKKSIKYLRKASTKRLLEN